jgi:hypothetical protein
MPSMLGITDAAAIAAWDRLSLRSEPGRPQPSALSMSGVTSTTPPSVT